MEKEAVFYNALTHELQGDYRRLLSFFEKYDSWEKAYAENFMGDPKKHLAKLQDLRLILREEKDFPALLREIPLPPFGIYLRGKLPEPGTRGVSIVGTRKATPEGEDLAYQFAKRLSQSGFNIVSGLAFGIDAAAHKGSLGGGRTFAVLATGPDDPYPRSNKKLAEDILAEGGGLISEYPPGSPPLPYRFLERNRIVSGLTEATLVIEAPERSGSLATARFALEQNREVFAVPGPAGHRNYAGSHALIREGARLVSSLKDVLEDLGIENAPRSIFHGTPEETLILATIEAENSLSFDEIVELTKLETAQVMRVLNSLLLSKKLIEKDSGYKII